MSEDHCRLVLEAAADDVERLGSELWDFGATGWQEIDGEWAGVPATEGRSKIVAYFPTTAMTVLSEASWSRFGGEKVSLELIGPVDWMARYRELSAPSPLGARFFVDPREPGSLPLAEPGERSLLRIPAREAFGTGSHESTRIAVRLLETAEVEGSRVLDVGIGTGILSFVAQTLGAGSVVGFDIDPASTFAVQENGSLNSLRVPAWCGTLAALGPSASFDLIVANVRPERLHGEYPKLAAALAPQGALLLSGFLGTELDWARSIADESRLSIERSEELDEWAGWVLRRRA